MKRLKQSSSASDLGKGKILVTKSITTKEDAIKAKMKAIEPKFFGMKMVKYDQGPIKKVWVPCYFLVFNYKIDKSLIVKNKEFFVRKGEVAVVYDANEMHTSHYDLIAEGEIPLIKKDTERIDGAIISDIGNMEEIMKNAERSVQRQILFKAYKCEGELNLIRSVKFYREAWELKVFYKDKEFIKYAYLDAYGIQSERARGLRARMDNM